MQQKLVIFALEAFGPINVPRTLEAGFLSAPARSTIWCFIWSPYALTKPTDEGFEASIFVTARCVLCQSYRADIFFVEAFAFVVQLRITARRAVLVQAFEREHGFRVDRLLLRDRKRRFALVAAEAIEVVTTRRQHPFAVTPCHPIVFPFVSFASYLVSASACHTRMSHSSAGHRSDLRHRGGACVCRCGCTCG